jgi:hypothetical protein
MRPLAKREKKKRKNKTHDSGTEIADIEMGPLGDHSGGIGVHFSGWV